MPGCIFHATGENFAVDAFLRGGGLRPYQVMRRGEPVRRTGRTYAHSGLKIEVSEVDGILAEQVGDAIRFLAGNEAELVRLRAFPGVGDLRLDFGYHARDVALPCEYLPPEFLLLAGRIGVGVELSLYPNPVLASEIPEGD